MHHWTKHLFAIAAPLLLTGCLWGPGKFNSDLTLKKDGSFILDYRGEIVLQMPPTMRACRSRGRDEQGEVRSDARRRTSALHQGRDRGAEKHAVREEAQKAEDMAKMFGLPGLDDASNRAFAAKLTKFAGWRSVTYRGNGVFDVDYHFAGRATQDFLFPALPDNDLSSPSSRIRRRADGAVLVTAPGFTGGAGPLGARAGAAAAGG